MAIFEPRPRINSPYVTAECDSANAVADGINTASSGSITILPNDSGDIIPIGGSYVPTVIGTGSVLTLPYTNGTFTYPHPIPYCSAEADMPELPNCSRCKVEPNIISSYRTTNKLILILECHGQTRRVELNLNKFVGDEYAARKWFLETVQYTFADDDVSTPPVKKSARKRKQKNFWEQWLDTR